MIWKAFRDHLSTSDLYDLNWDDTARVAGQLFRNRGPATLTLLWRLYQMAKHEMLNQGVWAALLSLASFCPAILLPFILDYMESRDTTSRNNAWLCVGGYWSPK